MAEEKESAALASIEEHDESPGEGDGQGPDDGATLLQFVLEEHDARRAEAPARIDGVLVGMLAAIDAGGAVRVTFPGGPDGGTLARAIAALAPGDVGQEVALLFEGGDPAQPVVMGKMHVSSTGSTGRAQVQTDGDKLVLSANKEIVLSCGDASITLTRAGKILIRGAYVLSRSSGVHRIQGGSVQIN